MRADKFRENNVFLTLQQAKLREQVEELAEKMNSRLDAVDPAFKTIAEALPKAAEEMKLAEGELKGLKAKEALTPEQKALKLLQDAEQQYELQVQMQRGGGGGGGGGSRTRWRRTSPTSSSSSSTSWRTSTRCSSAPTCRAPTSRSTTRPRS